MIETPVQLERELAERLAAVAVSNAANRLSAGTVRELTAEFRREIDADQAEHGAPIGEPDWNLVMSDADPSEPAVFVATLFEDHVVTFILGRAEASQVRRMCDRFTIAEVAEIRVALAGLEAGQDQEVAVPRGVAQLWLGV